MTIVRRRPFRILLGVDGSEHALAAARLIRDLPLPPDSEVNAVAVVTSRQTPDRDARSAALGAAQTILKEHGAEVQTGLLYGRPVEKLVQFADEHRSDLVVVGAQGLHVRLGIVLGGVAQQVVERARRPVLVVRAPPARLRRVLVATDGSPSSERAVNYLAGFPLPAGIEVRVMHVLPSLSLADFVTHGTSIATEMTSPPAPHEIEQMTRQAEAEDRKGQAILVRAVEVLRTTGIEAATVLRRGDAVTEIIEHVKAHNIDLVVAGSRGRRAVTGWLLGSVSRKLVHSAGCSVLIVKGLTTEAVVG